MLVLSYSLGAGAATVLGAALIAVGGRPGKRMAAFALGLSGGVMLTVVISDLLPTAWRLGGCRECILGFVSGWLLAGGFDFLLRQAEKEDFSSLMSLRRLGWLTVLGIAVHDFPEGMAIAMGCVAAENLGFLLALAVGLHNIPEGMATAAPLRAGGLSRAQVLAVNVLLALATPAGAVLGMVLARRMPDFLSFMLALAAGTMGYLSMVAMLPNALRYSWLLAFAGFLLGSGVILLLQSIIQGTSG